MQLKNSKPYRKGVSALIIDTANRFLLIQKNGYKDNEWNFVGGGQEKDETIEQNLFREINEELGVSQIDFEIIGFSQHKITYDYPPEIASKVNGGKFRGQSYDQVILRFIGDKSKLAFTPKEFRDHKWVEFDELKDYLVFPNQYLTHLKAIKEILPQVKKPS